MKHRKILLCLAPLILASIACGSTTRPTATLFILPTPLATSANSSPASASIEPILPNAPTSDLTDNHTPTNAPTSTQTYTPGPTDTPNILTLTRDPTWAYAEQRDDIIWLLRDIKADIDPTFGLYIEGRVSPQDAMWQAEIELLFGQFDEGVEWYMSLTPPAPFREENERTSTGIVACSLGFWSLYDGAVTQDAELYQSGVDYIGVCNTEWDAGDLLFAQIISELGLILPEN